MKLILKNILTILNRREKRSLAVFIILNIIISVLDIAFLALLLLVIDFYTGNNSSKTFPFISDFFNLHPLLLISCFFLFFSLKNLTAFLIFKAQYGFVYSVASRISKKNLLNYLEGSYNEFVNIDSSVNIRKISQQPIEFSQYILTGIQQIITQTALILFTVIAVIFFNAMLFLLLFIILLPAVFVIAYISKRKLSAVRLNVKTTGQKAIQHLNEALSGYVESNLYDKTAFFSNRYYSYQQKLNGYLSDQQIIQGMPSRFIEIFAIFGLFLLVLVSVGPGNSTSIPIITIGAFTVAAYKIIPGIVKVLNSAGQIRTYEFVINDLLQNISLRKTDTAAEKINSVEFKNVSFAYDQRGILNDFSLKIKAGEFIGFYGNSGVGKTTIINLLLGFLSPEKGTISINNDLTQSSDRRSFWRNIAYVKQQPFLIHDTILQNIVLAENYDTQRLQDAVNASGLNEFLDTIPEGLQKIITENGKNISGGQQQRIIIARALYKDADLIILDEPFNELDEESEVSILKKLHMMTQEGKIIILITHNKAGLSFCTQIVSLDEKE